jgi:hypothetical protein
MREALTGAFSVLVLDSRGPARRTANALVAGDWTALASI